MNPWHGLDEFAGVVEAEGDDVGSLLADESRWRPPLAKVDVNAPEQVPVDVGAQAIAPVCTPAM